MKSIPKPVQIVGRIIAVGAVIYMFVLPLFPSAKESELPSLFTQTNAELFTLTLMLTSVALAINWNLTGGFTGYVDFGHAVWFGTGAYVTAILMSSQSPWIPQEWPLIPSLIIGALVSGLLANLVGRLTLRLSGAYFSIAMLGFFVFMREVMRVFRPLTNGGTGLTLPPTRNVPLWFYVQLVLVLILIAFTWWLRRTRFGASLVAIREDETGAEMRGINTTRNKVWIFTFSAFSTGLFGSMWVYQNTAVEPDVGYIEVRTIDAVMGTMLGGLGTVVGPVIGMVSLYWLREVVWANFLDYHQIVQAIILGFIVLYLPKGLVGLVGGDSGDIRNLFGRRKDADRSSTFDGMETALDEEGNVRAIDTTTDVLEQGTEVRS